MNFATLPSFKIVEIETNVEYSGVSHQEKNWWDTFFCASAAII